MKTIGKARFKSFIAKALLVMCLMVLTTVAAPRAEAALSMDDSDDNRLIIAFDPSLPPYQFEADGSYVGFNLDLMRAIEEATGLNFQLVPLTLSESLDKFQKREIDAILGIRYTSQMEDQMDFSDSLVNSTISIIAPTDKIEDYKTALGIEPVLIAVERGSIEFEFVKNVKKANFHQAFNQQAVFELLMMNRADLMIGVRHVAEYLLDQNHLGHLYTISNSFETPVDFYLGVHITKRKALTAVNGALRDLKLSGGYETIYNTWINDKAMENQKRIERNLIIMMLIIVSAFFIAAVAGYINVQLKRKVAEKTEALSTANDALERKIIEIRNATELKDLMFESSPRSITIVDGDGRVSAMNAPALALCGLNQTPTGEFIHQIEPLNLMLETSLESVLTEGESLIGKELDYISAGRRWALRYFIYPLRDDARQLRGAILTVEDFTQEKILREQIAEEEKNRALIQMISGIAHEIRNPLTSIKAYVELLPRKKDSEAFQKQLIKVVPSEVERVSRLIENLIDYVRPKNQNIKTIRVHDLLESCVMLFQHTATSRGIEFRMTADPLLTLRADEDQLKQVIINLLLNAIDAICEKLENPAGADGPWIRLAAQSVDSGAQISISDNGIGMTPSELTQVYELFYTTKAKGSGIGLPLSKQIIEDNQGTMEIVSVKHQGTTIRLTFGGDAQ